MADLRIHFHIIMKINKWCYQNIHDGGDSETGEDNETCKTETAILILLLCLLKLIM
jgi:hypothetical protein